MSLASRITQLPHPDSSRQYLDGVKEILQEFKAMGLSESSDNICSNMECLVRLYLKCPCRLAAKRAMASFFQSVDDISREMFEQQLCDQLKECLQVNASLNDASASTRQCVDNINALMENFKLGERCLFKIFSHVINFLIQAEKYFLSSFGPDVPPVGLNEVMLNCHVTMQTTNLLLQKTAAYCPQRIDEFMATTEQLSHLMDLNLEIIHNDSFLLDCRCCCAMNAFILLQLAVREINAADVIPSLLSPKASGPSQPAHPSWLTQIHANSLALDPTQPLTFLAITFGYIAMVLTSHISHRLPSNDFFYLDVLLPQTLHLGKSCEDTSSKTLYAKTVNLWTSKLLSTMEEATLRNQMASKLKGEGRVIESLLDYVWTHWEDQLDVLHQSAKTVFENVLKLHVQACIATCVDSCPFILSLVEKVLAVSWSSRGKFGALTSCTHHVTSTVLLSMRPSLPNEVLRQHQEQAVSCYASELYCCLFLSHRKEMIASTLPSDNEDPSPQNTVILFHDPTGDQCSTLMEVWIRPIIQAMHSDHAKWKQNIIEYLLPKLMKSEVGILDFMIKEMSSPEGSESNVSQAHGAVVMCVRRARSIGLLKSKLQSHANGLWFGILPPSILESTLCSLNEQIRLDAFALLCDNCKTSEAISSFEFDMLQSFIPHNVNSQSPAFRQAFLALLKKLFFRLKESLGLLNRQVARNKSTAFSASIKNYESFLTWLASFFLSNIYPGSTFARRTTCLVCLTLMTSFFNSGKDGFSVLDQLTEHHLQSFIECISDTFEENKKEALSMFTSYIQAVGRIATSDKLKTILDVSFALAHSTKPQDCSTAAYLFELTLRQPGICEVFLDFQPHLKSDQVKLKFQQVKSAFMSSNVTIDPVTVEVVSSSYLLNLLCLSLNDQIEVARSSLVTAAASRPMYPTLHCIRFVLQSFKWNAVTNSLLPLVKDFINDLILTCLNLAEVVSPVVQNSSPEGNVPAQAILSPECNISEILQSLNIGDNDNTSKMKIDAESQCGSHKAESEHETEVRPKATAHELAQSLVLSQTLVEAMPEYLVVCCWRSIKEVSLTLGKLCLQIPISRINQNLITKNDPMVEASCSPLLMSLDQVKVMGEYFTCQLLESIHRGAFELAYAGFQLMCQMLWSHPLPAFHKLPSQWLAQVMMDIKSHQSNLCATRRSAGVPFYIQAITSSEPSAAGRKCFHSCMQELLVLSLGQGEIDKIPKDAQVHALNILRTLYRDARLGEEVVPYISDGLKAAILGFKSELWAVRNSATLLLSALMTRIFGVKRSKDESAMSKKNCLTGRVFFHRYPGLYQFLLNELESATATVCRQDIIQLHPSLYPILLVLGRLFPSTLEGADTSLSLSAFIPYILKCAASPVYKTRVIAARALQPLAKRSQITEIIEELLSCFPSSPSALVSSNLMHGSLMQLCQLLKLVSSFSETVKKKVLSVFIPKFTMCSWLLSPQNPCYATRQGALKLVDSVLDLVRSVSPLMEDLKMSMKSLERHFLSSLTNFSSNVFQWKPFFYDFEKTRANLTIKHLLTIFDPNSEQYQREREATECGDSIVHEEKNNCDGHFDQKEQIALDILSSAYYEVRLEMLNGMIISCGKRSCTSLLRERNEGESFSEDTTLPNQAGGEADMGDETSMVPAHFPDKNQAMMRKLSNRLFNFLLTRAMEREDHHECLEKVFQLLAVIPDRGELLCVIGHVNLKKVLFNLLCKIKEERRTQVKTSMLRFSSCIVTHLYEGLESSKRGRSLEDMNVLLEWINIQIDFSRNDADPELQLAVAFSLLDNARLLLCDPHQKLGLFSLHCWDVLAILLQADDLEVKEIASSTLAIACGHHRDAFHPSFALHKLPEFLISHQARLGFGKLFKSLISWILLEEASIEKDTEERLFERGDMNTYWDQIAFSRSVELILMQVINSFQKDSTSFCGGQEFDKTELEEFISLMTLKLLQKLEIYEDNISMSDVFTNPGKYTDAFQAIYHANILAKIFKECQNLNISLPQQLDRLEKLTVSLQEVLSMGRL